MLFLSLGENCLPDNILNRYHLKSFSTPFSSCRSNIEYILQCEEDCYKNLEDDSFYVSRKNTHGVDSIFNTSFHSDECYNKTSKDGFEFPHHDIITSGKDKDSIKRKINRMSHIKGLYNIVFLYHYRYCDNYNMDKILTTADKISGKYSINNKKVHFNIMRQMLVANKFDRHLDYKVYNNMHIYTFYTTSIWQGENQNIFWARADEDFVSMMVHSMYQSATGRSFSNIKPMM